MEYLKKKYLKKFFPEKMQEAIINLIDKNLQTFDWILVDEAQDLFSKPIIDSLSMLKNKNLGKLILGLDVGLQSEVFKNFDKAYYDEVIKDSEVIKLYSNFRNPKNIAMKAVEVCGINNIEDFKRAFDSPIRFKFIEKNIIYELKELLLELIDEKILNQKILLYSPLKLVKKVF